MRSWIYLACLGLVVAPIEVEAQDPGWNNPFTLGIVRRAIERRQQQFADAGLIDYTAQATGYLTFLAQLGEGFPDPPAVVKADQLATELLWRAPDFSKQRLIGQRDTLLLPARVGYYRDRYGIVQNNLPDVIRMGDARDVRDVPHPLSPLGPSEYDFAVRDSLTLRSAGVSLNVYRVTVRPHNTDVQRFLGDIYLERSSGAVVRMQFTFTQAALLDKRIESLSVVLENALIAGKYWLPFRQELEVVRQARWLDFPARGIIRGRWEVCCYELNVGLPPEVFRGPEIVRAPLEQMRDFEFEGSIVDSLPDDVLLVTDADVEQVRAQASELVRQSILNPPSGASLSARRISDFARLNRVEGLALGLGGAIRLQEGTALRLNGRFGVQDESLKGRMALSRGFSNNLAVTLFGERDYRDMGDVEEASLLKNSLAAGLFANDYTQPYDVWSAGASVDLGISGGTRLSVTASYERHGRLAVNASPLSGEYNPTVPAWSLEGGRLVVSVARRSGTILLGTELGWDLELTGGLFEGRDTTLSQEPLLVGRVAARLDAVRRFGSAALVFRTVAAVAGGSHAVPPQAQVYLGGTISGPGYRFHEFASDLGVSQRVEGQFRVPFISAPVLWYGKAPPSATLAPYFHLVYTGDPAPFSNRARGVYPAVGLGALFLFDLLRFDIARGLRDGSWTFSVDVTKTLWGIL
ncbi:MAG: hypothetical protein JSW71_23165 [Gemmatimonadota bacterium]|nr:MAG: hypothetical protein JSW71_23165 [Gemmatimonadota bacterium]